MYLNGRTCMAMMHMHVLLFERRRGRTAEEDKTADRVKRTFCPRQPEHTKDRVVASSSKQTHADEAFLFKCTDGAGK